MVEYTENLSEGDAQKFEFMTSALCRSFDEGTVVFPNSLQQALEWIELRTPAERIAERERVIGVIESIALKLYMSGESRRWYSEADDAVIRVASGVNGALLEQLARATNYWDCECVEFFRKGAPMYGVLPVSGNGVPQKFAAASSVEELLSSALANNRKLVKSLKEDKHSQALFETTCNDAALGRMTFPVAVSDLDLSKVLLAQRFGVEQGVKDDGSVKIRCIDDETRAGVNPCTQPSEKLKLDGIDSLFHVVKWFVSVFGVAPHLFKADVDAAYRRIPVAPEHRWAMYVVFPHQGVPVVSGHLSAPFGASASVHAWDRVGALLCYLGRTLLKLPLLRYVDDLFSMEHPDCTEHAMQCFARLVRCLLGPTAISEKKLESGMPLTILGLVVHVTPSALSCWPSKDKVVKWLSRVSEALALESLSPGNAGKLAGAFSWTSQNIFHRLGRAMLVPLYKHQHRRFGKQVFPESLKMCLRWWQEVLSLELSQTKPFLQDQRKPVHLFADARGEPARIAAVLLVDGQLLYTDCEPHPIMVQAFKERKDNQIMGWELFAIALGISAFVDLLRDRTVVVWSDNTGSESGTSKGRAKEFDHSCIIHCIWLFAAQNRMRLRIERVPTKDNIADLPSREEYCIPCHCCVIC